MPASPPAAHWCEAYPEPHAASRCQTATNRRHEEPSLLAAGVAAGGYSPLWCFSVSPSVVTDAAQARTHRRRRVTMQQGTDAGIYGRTQQVQDVIMAGISGVSDCMLVTDAHLAAITTLNLSGKGMTALHADDFAGLIHLQELRLSGNALATLPAGVFSGLTELTFLFLDDTVLTTLPADVFSDLTALELLYLSNNALTTLPATVFRDLTRLQSLYLSNNALTMLPGSLLDDLEARGSPLI